MTCRVLRLKLGPGLGVVVVEGIGDYLGQAQPQHGVGHTDKNMQTMIKMFMAHLMVTECSLK